MRGLNENVPVPDIFSSGVAAIERLEGNCFRLYFYVSQCDDDDVKQEKVLVAKLILPACALADAIMKMTEPAAEQPPAMVALLRGLTTH